MTDSDIRSCFVTLKKDFTFHLKLLECGLKVYNGNITIEALVILHNLLENLQSCDAEISDAGLGLMMSVDKQTRLYGEAEMEEIDEKMMDIQKRFNEITRTPKIEQHNGDIRSEMRGIVKLDEGGIGPEMVGDEDICYNVGWTTKMVGWGDYATMDSWSHVNVGGEVWVEDYLRRQDIDLNDFIVLFI